MQDLGLYLLGEQVRSDDLKERRKQGVDIGQGTGLRAPPLTEILAACQ